MNVLSGSPLRFLLATTAATVGLFWSGEITINDQAGLVSTAHAVIGRPATPMSYAGVARRTTRRAVAVGAGAATVGAAAAYGSACVQAVDAYGRVYTRC